MINLNSYKLRNILTITSFCLYLLVAIWIYYFKLNIIPDLRFLRWDPTFNWIPFSDVFHAEKGFSLADLILQFLNIIGFILVGYLASGIVKKYNFTFGVLFSLLFTILIELMQYLLSFGSGQLGDILMNGLGGIIGAFLYMKLNKKIPLKIQNILYISISGISLVFVILGFIFTCLKWSEYISK